MKYNILQNLEITVPPLNIQQQIIHKIEQLNNHQSHYQQYALLLQNELNYIIDTIENMTLVNESINDNIMKLIKKNELAALFRITLPKSNRGRKKNSIDELMDKLNDIVKNKKYNNNKRNLDDYLKQKDYSMDQLIDKLNDKNKNKNKSIIEI